MGFCGNPCSRHDLLINSASTALAEVTITTGMPEIKKKKEIFGLYYRKQGPDKCNCRSSTILTMSILQLVRNNG